MTGRVTWTWGVLCMALLANVALAAQPQNKATAEDSVPKTAAVKPEASVTMSNGSWLDPSTLATRDTLTNNWFGIGKQLEDSGITVSLGLTQIYQINMRGGAFTHKHAGRYTGSWDLELEIDPGTLLKSDFLKNGKFYMAAEGSWSDGLNGTTPASVGSLFGVNADAAGDRSIDVTQYWYQHNFLDDKVRVRIGKVDIDGGFKCHGCDVAFDTNAFASDETSQFLNGALTGNPTIPAPDNGLGVILYVEPIEGMYLAAAITDGEADSRETGFATTFGGPDYFFSIYEMGFVPQFDSAKGKLPGTYRVGLWYHPYPITKYDGSGTQRDTIGVYTSCDQVVWKENADKDDMQGLGAFFRYGLSDADVEAGEIKAFYSAGVQYQGVIPGRDDDVVGLGFAYGAISKQSGHTANNESVIEGYYNIQITPWMTVTPSLQVIFNPGGENTGGVHDAVVAGIRMQWAF